MPQPTMQRIAPTRIIELGSGTATAPVVSKMAPLFAVAAQSGLLADPSFRNATRYDASGRLGLIFSRGLTFGLAAP
jgi:hypothetical protein